MLFSTVAAVIYIPIDCLFYEKKEYYPSHAASVLQMFFVGLVIFSTPLHKGLKHRFLPQYVSFSCPEFQLSVLCSFLSRAEPVLMPVVCLDDAGSQRKHQPCLPLRTLVQKTPSGHVSFPVTRVRSLDEEPMLAWLPAKGQWSPSSAESESHTEL